MLRSMNQLKTADKNGEQRKNHLFNVCHGLKCCSYKSYQNDKTQNDVGIQIKKNVISLSISKHYFLSARFLINIKLKPEINEIDPTYKKSCRLKLSTLQN